jgi:4-amino-4-deoxy-L-arabinose transferase-like glycosyltransferase
MLSLLLLAFIVLALAFSVVDPLFEPPDELPHYRYIRDLIETHRLPVLELGGGQLQSHQPPLYYLLGAGLIWWLPSNDLNPWFTRKNDFWAYASGPEEHYNKNQYLHCDEAFPYKGIALGVHLVRLLSVLLGAVSVWITYRIGRELWPTSPELAWGGASLVAFTPMFLFISGAINNDTPVTTLSAATLWLCILTLRQGFTLKKDLLLGLILGAAILTKISALALLPIVGFTLIARAKLHQEPSGLWKSASIILAILVISTGWWFVRNWLLYGDPTAITRTLKVWHERPEGPNVQAAIKQLDYAWSSFWGRFGYGQIPLPNAIYDGFRALTAVSACGLIVAFLKKTIHRALSAQMLSDGILVIAFPALFLVAMFYYMSVSLTGSNGRYLFPALPAIGLLLVRGLVEWVPRHWWWKAAVTLAVVMLAIALVSLVGYLAPSYARPKLLSESAMDQIQDHLHVQYGEGIELVGYRLPKTNVTVGDPLPVTLYWKALRPIQVDYVVGLALLGKGGEPWAKLDTYHGSGKFPTSCWKPGEFFADHYLLHVGMSSEDPVAGQMIVTLHDSKGNTLPAKGLQGLLLPTVIFGQVRVAPQSLPLYSPQNPLAYSLGGMISLLGYDLPPGTLHAGETLTVTLYWKAQQNLTTSYHVFVHLVAKDQTLVAQQDGPPSDGAYPCTLWQVNEVVKDTHHILLPKELPPGDYELRVGMYALQTGERLEVASDISGSQSYVVLTSLGTQTSKQ